MFDDGTRDLISRAWAEPARREDPEVRRAVDRVVAALDGGELRVAEPDGDGWRVNAWVKEAVLLYFPLRGMETMEAGIFEFYDKVPVKTGYKERGIRAVPPAVARHGAYIAPGVVMMPSYVNIGAYVDVGTMIDTWATVGSCAQIGRDVHLSGGVGIGGVLEPVQAQPVIIEDGAFVGSRAIVVEGVRVRREAVIGAGVVLTASTPIIDVTGRLPLEMRGDVPERAVVIPGTRAKRFPAGEYGVPCALIIGTRRESTDRKTSLNAALREHDVAV